MCDGWYQTGEEFRRWVGTAEGNGMLGMCGWVSRSGGNACGGYGVGIRKG